ncbi:MAG: orotidine-5'-phosphate decarboxylase [Candidatus Aminicenantes bacterium]|nr:orotidine-5'-phosphate decarboxylase [Candidatus Aminicenantes bacterium]
MKAKDNLVEKIIVALDVAEREKALSLVDELPEVRWFKIGLELFTSCGPSLIEEIKDKGHQIFLDLKLHDIPNTVAGAIRAAVRHGVSMLTLHIFGGREMMLKAREVAQEESQRKGLTSPKLIGVTILTSLNDEDLELLGLKEKIAPQILRLSHLARECGLDGCVCSPQEISLLRQEHGPEWLLITPGVRPAWAASNDQKRILSPAEALNLGASFLVIGRPIIGQPSPRQAFLKLIEELKS